MFNNFIRKCPWETTWYVGDKFILIEKHKPQCTCSYCHDAPNSPSSKLQYGLNIPENWKAVNSWYVIKIPFRIYIRSCVMGWFKNRKNTL